MEKGYKTLAQEERIETHTLYTHNTHTHPLYRRRDRDVCVCATQSLRRRRCMLVLVLHKHVFAVNFLTQPRIGQTERQSCGECFLGF